MRRARYLNHPATKLVRPRQPRHNGTDRSWFINLRPPVSIVPTAVFPKSVAVPIDRGHFMVIEWDDERVERHIVNW